MVGMESDNSPDDFLDNFLDPISACAIQVAAVHFLESNESREFIAGTIVWASVIWACSGIIKYALSFSDVSSKTIWRNNVGLLGRSMLAPAILLSPFLLASNEANTVKKAIGLGCGGLVAMALYKRFSVTDVLSTVQKNALFFVSLGCATSLLSKNGGCTNRGLAISGYFTGIALACSNEESLSRLARSTGMAIFDRPEKFHKFSYLPYKWVNHWQDKDSDDGNAKVTIKRHRLQSLFEEAEKSRLRKTPFVLRGAYWALGLVRKKRAGVIEQILHARGKLQQSVDKALAHEKMPLEIRANIYKYCQEDSRFAYDKKKLEFSSPSEDEKLIVFKKDLRRELLPYLESSDWNIKGKKTIPIKRGNTISNVKVKHIGIVA
jgi:hypothetical protein